MIRTGDIILSKNEELKETNMYLVRFNEKNNDKTPYELICLTCGDVVCSLPKEDLNAKKLNEYVPTIKYIITKEEIIDIFNNNYNLEYPVKLHNSIIEKERMNCNGID